MRECRQPSRHGGRVELNCGLTTMARCSATRTPLVFYEEDSAMLTPGDILIIHNTPFPLATRIISRVSDGNTSHHCATASTDGFGIAVYDVCPPKARRQSAT